MHRGFICFCEIVRHNHNNCSVKNKSWIPYFSVIFEGLT